MNSDDLYDYTPTIFNKHPQIATVGKIPANKKNTIIYNLKHKTFKSVLQSADGLIKLAWGYAQVER